jgi:excisionase family DNA binding protein
MIARPREPTPQTRPSDEQPGPTSRPVARAPTPPIVRLSASDVMTGREVANLLHAPVSTVEDWARRDILPSVKIGRRRLYIRQHIESVLVGR